MFRPFAMLGLVFLAGGCVIVQPQVTNPLPNVTRVAVVPFANHSIEPALDTVLVTNAYYAELQQVPGFEVVPISVTAKAIETFSLRMQSPRDALELARVLDVDAVVVGAITDYDPYDPPRIGWHVEWYSPHAPDFARGVPVDPHLRPDVPRGLLGGDDDCCEPGCTADGSDGCTNDSSCRTAGRSRRETLGRRAEAGQETVFRGQSPREWQRTRPGTEEYETVRRVFRPRLLRPDSAGVSAAGVRRSVHRQSTEDRGAVENAIEFRTVEVHGDHEQVEPLTPPTERRLNEQTIAPPSPTTEEPPFPFEQLPPIERPTIRTVSDETAPGVEPLFPDTVESPAVEPAVADEDVLPPQPPRSFTDDAELDDAWGTEPSSLDSSLAWTGGGDENPPTELPPPAGVPNGDWLDDPPGGPSAPKRPVFETGPGRLHDVPAMPSPSFGVAMSAPAFDPQEPIMAFTRVYDGRDQDLLARLRDYYELNGDERAGGWRGYLQRSDDFIRFTAHVSIVEMLTLHGGETRRRYVWKLRTRS